MFFLDIAKPCFAIPSFLATCPFHRKGHHDQVRKAVSPPFFAATSQASLAGFPWLDFQKFHGPPHGFYRRATDFSNKFPSSITFRCSRSNLVLKFIIASDQKTQAAETCCGFRHQFQCARSFNTSQKFLPISQIACKKIKILCWFVDIPIDTKRLVRIKVSI